MAKERKRGARKQTGKSARAGGKRRARKPKVRLSARKVYVLSGVIVLLCAASLSMSVVMSARAEGAQVAGARAVETGRVPVPAEAARHEARSQPSVPQEAGRQTVAQERQKETEWVAPAARRQDTPNPAAVQRQDDTVRKPVAPPAPAQPRETAARRQAPEMPAHGSGAAPSVAMARPSGREGGAKKLSFAVPPARNGATLVFVIDDAGRSAENVRKYVSLPFPLTVAVLPRLPQSRTCADVVREAGKEAILHQPMQAMDLRLNPGAGAVTATMGGAEIAAVIRENLAELGPGIVGLNNHEGSLITADLVRIGVVLDVCAERGIYFLDSRTTAETKAPQAARERGMAIFEKAGPYIDNDIDRDKMLARLYETLAYANAHGIAIVIGHVDKSVAILPALLAELYPHLAAQGYRFATPSMLR